jgi:hypothetical protein
VSARPAARAFLSWWQNRVYEHCRHDVAHGVYYDQRWLDLAVVFFEDVYVFRDPSFNVAHWNLPERAIRIGDDTITVERRDGRMRMAISTTASR